MNPDRTGEPAVGAHGPGDAGAYDTGAYEAGLRAGYAHGYDIGLEHGRARAESDLDLPAADLPRGRFAGPDRAELLARGYIPLDRTRPPALPARLWTAQDWAQAETRDLPTTEHGRAQWQAALDAGRVPPRLAEAYNEGPATAEPNPDSAAASLAEAFVEGRATAKPGPDLAVDLARDVADTAHVVAQLRARLERTGAAGRRCRTEQAPWRGAEATDVLEADACDRGIGR